jgi:hypothetical protein
MQEVLMKRGHQVETHPPAPLTTDKWLMIFLSA